jgi:hypothetical protein
MTGGHLTPVVLAEYDEGLLPERRAADVAAHLAHCATCTETHRQLDEVSHRLAAEPATLPVPPDVAARLDAALAEQRTIPAGAEVGPLRRRTRSIVARRPWRARMPAVLAAAASVGAIAFAGYVIGIGSAGGDDAGDSQPMVAEGGAERAADESELPAAEEGDDPALDGPAQGLSGLSPQATRTTLTEQIKAIMVTGSLESSVGLAPTADSGDQDESRDQDADPCGAALAADVGRELIGAAPTDLGPPGTVLVVTTASTDDAVQGWVVPTCDATAADAAMTLVVPAE